MRGVSIIAAGLCVAAALGAAPAAARDAHGGPSGGNDQYPYWYSTGGTRMPADLIRSTAADAPCGPGIVLLQIGNLGRATARTYLRDPEHRIGDSVVAGAYVARAEMPYDAVETGLHQDGKDLLLTRDASFAYLVGDDGVERWPALTTTTGLTCD